MSPRTRQSLIIAAVAVGVAALGGIAAILGWLPERFTTQTATSSAPGSPLRISGTAPPESLSPGESIVATPPPVATPPAPIAHEPPKTQAAPPKPGLEPERREPRRHCANCGVVSSTTRHDRDVLGGAYEVRVRFDDGTRLTLRYPTSPGFRAGDRVFFSEGRLRRQ